MSRALAHDGAQIDQWLSYEEHRYSASTNSIAQKEDHLLNLSNGHFPTGPCDPEGKPLGGLGETMSKLKREMTSRSQMLLDAEEEEDKAKQVSGGSDWCGDVDPAVTSSFENLMQSLSFPHYLLSSSHHCLIYISLSSKGLRTVHQNARSSCPRSLISGEFGRGHWTEEADVAEGSGSQGRGGEVQRLHS
jgi:hypothetical protein